MTRAKGIKRLLCAALIFVLTVVMTVSAAFPAGSLNLTPEMLENMQGFVNDYMQNGTIEHDKIEEFLKDFITDMGEAEKVDGVISDLEKLEEILPKNDEGEPDYGHILDHFKQDENESKKDTLDTVLGVVSKTEKVEEILQFVEGKQEEENKKIEAEEKGEEYVPDRFTVEWYLGNSPVPILVQEDMYLKNDIYRAPEIKLPAGDYILWDHGALFKGEYEADGVTPAVTKVYGVMHNLTEEFINITNGIGQIEDVYEATLSDDGSTVVIAIDAQKADYVDLLTSFRSENSNASLKEDALQILTDTLSAVMFAGVNGFSVNGKHLLSIDSYDIDELLDIIKSKKFEDLVNIDNIISVIREEDKSLDRFIDMERYYNGYDDRELYKFGECTLTLEKDGAASTDVNLVFTLEGDVSNIETAASLIRDIVSVERDGSKISVGFNLSSANVQVILKRAYSNAHTPESVRKHIVKIQQANEFGRLEDYYVVSGEMTFGEMKDLIKNADYDFVGDKVGIDNLTENEKFRKLFDKVMSYIPDSYDDKTYFDLYDGNGDFKFTKTITKDMVESKVEQYLGGRKISLLGKTLNVGELAAKVTSKVLEKINADKVTLSGNLHIGDYREIILRDALNPDIQYVFFAEPGISLDALASLHGLIPEGYHMVYVLDGNNVTETPAEDAVILYSSGANTHTVTYTITFTDKGVVYNTVTFDVVMAYGTAINAFVAMAGKVEGHTYVDGTLAGVPADGKMPDSDVSISATYDLNYYTVEWVVNGNVVETDIVPHGTTPEYNGATPTLPSGEVFKTLEFTHWSPVVGAAEADVTYEAVFEKADRFSDPLDENVTEEFTYDENKHVLNLQVNAKPGVDIDGSKHSIEEIMGLLHDFVDEAPTVIVTHKYSGVILNFSHDNIEAIYNSFGGDLEGASYTTKMSTFDSGINAGRKYFSIQFSDKEGNPIAIEGLTGTPLVIPYVDDGNPETYPVVRYYNPVTGENEDVDYEFDFASGTVSINTNHFSTFVIEEVTKTYDITTGATVNGSIATDITNTAKGETVTVTVTPDTHYELKRLYYVDVNGMEHDISGTTFTMPSGAVTVKAEFGRIVYTVIFCYEDGTPFLEVEVESGRTFPTEKIPAGPDKAMTVDKIFTFAFWEAKDAVGADVDLESGAIITSNVNVRPIYNDTARTYPVTFLDWEGNVIGSVQNVAYGNGATAPAAPARPADSNYTYKFIGWDVDFSNITGALEVRAQYKATPIEVTTETDTETTTEPDDTTTEPDETTTEPDDTTTEPDDTTTEDTTDVTTEDTTDVTTEDTTDVTTEDTTDVTTEDTTDDVTVIPGGSDTTDADDDKPSAGTIVLIVILIILLILILLVVVGYLLYIKGILPAFFLWLLLDKLFGRNNEEKTETEATTAENVQEPAPVVENLFIPIGEEIPEEESEEVVHLDHVSVEEVDEIMTDTTAEHVITMSDKVGGTGKLGIINVGTLSGTFQADDLVNLEILKDKDMIDDNIGRLKVLASGSINKPLVVEADAFSLQAIKMITITGGKAVKLKASDGTAAKADAKTEEKAPAEDKTSDDQTTED